MAKTTANLTGSKLCSDGVIVFEVPELKGAISFVMDISSAIEDTVKT
jgi:hypothetical protein